MYVDKRGTSADLAAALATALQDRGFSIAAVPSSASASVIGTAQVTVRKSPFENVAALTADYVGTLTVRRSPAAGVETLQFDGHALEFGESTAHAAALRGLANQMAEAIVNAVPDKPRRE